MPSNHLILCRPLLLLPSIFPTIRVFSNKSAFYIRWPKYWSFRFCINPSIKYSGLISFTIDWFDLFAFHGTQESSPISQLKSINSSALSFLHVQLSHPYMTTGKTIALTIRTFVCKKKEAVIPQETNPDLPMSVQESPAEAWSTVACCRIGVCIGPFEGGHHYLHYLHHSLASGQTTWRKHCPAYQQKVGLKIY